MNTMNKDQNKIEVDLSTPRPLIEVYADITKDIDWERCPETVRDSLKNYVERRLPLGGFLNSVLANDLWSAMFKADLDNRALIYEIVTFIHWEIVPTLCYGSYEKIEAWIRCDDISEIKTVRGENA